MSKVEFTCIYDRIMPSGKLQSSRCSTRLNDEVRRMAYTDRFPLLYFHFLDKIFVFVRRFITECLQNCWIFSYRLFPLPLQACFAVLSCRVLSTETVITSRVGFKISLAETTKFTRSGYVAVWPVRILHRNILNANPVRCLLRINYRRNTQELITMAKS